MPSYNAQNCAANPMPVTLTGLGAAIRQIVVYRGFAMNGPWHLVKRVTVKNRAATITDERAENLDFSEGYYDSLQSLLVPADSDIAGIGDLSGKRVAVQQGTTGESYATENAEGAELVSFPSDAEMYQAILASQVDAVLQDLPANVPHTADGKFTIVEEYDTDETYGLAIKKGNTALVDAVNEQLTEMRDSGQYDEFYNQYFSEDAAGDEAESTGR